MAGRDSSTSTPWPYGEIFQQLFYLPAPLAPYTPDFRYTLCDLTGLADTDIRGAVLLRVTLWIMKLVWSERVLSVHQVEEIFAP